MVSEKDFLPTYEIEREALQLFEKMQQSGFKLDCIAFSNIQTTCANLEALEYGKSNHAQIIESGYYTDISKQN